MNEATRSAVRRLRALDACTVSDALDRLGLTGQATGVPQHSGEGRIAGVVTTLKIGTGEPPPGPPRHLGTVAIESSGAEHVIVIEQTTGLDAGCWGGLLSQGAVVRGIAGVIADGPVRDIDEARGLGLPIYCRTLTARTARGRVVEKGTNVPVMVWGVTVDAGDFVVADRSAVVFIAAAQIERVLEAAEAIAARESRMAEAIRAGHPISAVMGGSYEKMLKG